jgi:predicted dehydrogenase
MKNIRIGIIGVGQIGNHHLDVYSKLPGVELVAACDIDAAELSRVATQFKIPHTYAAFRELLQRDDLDAVDVCLHNNLHAPVSIAVMKSGKHCYCEKPMAGSFADAQAMFDASRSTGKMLHIQLAKLYDRGTRFAKHLIDQGALGEIYHARSAGFRRRGRPFVDGYGTTNFVQKHISAGGAMYDMGVYHVSRALYLLGIPQISRISGKVYAKLPMHEGRRASSGFNVDELGLGFVKFTNGATLDVAESWAIQLDTIGPSYVAGTLGGVKLEPLTFHSTINDLEANTTFDEGQIEFRLNQTEPSNLHYSGSQQHWIAALRNDVKLLPTAQIALDTMLVSEGIYLSDHLGREVSSDEVRQMSKSSAVEV